MSGIGPMAEEEAHVLSSAALTRVFSHLHLHDPTTRLDEPLEPVDDEHCATTAVAMKNQVEALLKKFRTFATPALVLTSCWSLWLMITAQPPPQPCKVRWRPC